jgi:ABC-type sulfate/molybdate transport systems ATPase subunit
MLEFALDARRGGFHLQVDCRLASEWTVIFGPSGAGKSTLLRLLAGLERPDSGRISLDQELLTDQERGVHLKAGRRHTTLVAQRPALFPHLSVAANVAYGLSNLPGERRGSRVTEMLELVDGTELRGRSPRDLSGGEAQRIALARALAPLPRLLLLDEPFSALDGAASDALLSRLRTWLRQHHVQTVVVTHDASDAFATGAEVALLREGRLVAQGEASAVLDFERARLIQRLDANSSCTGHG